MLIQHPYIQILLGLVIVILIVIVVALPRKVKIFAIPFAIIFDVIMVIVDIKLIQGGLLSFLGILMFCVTPILLLASKTVDDNEKGKKDDLTKK